MFIWIGCEITCMCICSLDDDTFMCKNMIRHLMMRILTWKRRVLFRMRREEPQTMFYLYVYVHFCLLDHALMWSWCWIWHIVDYACNDVEIAVLLLCCWPIFTSSIGAAVAWLPYFTSSIAVARFWWCKKPLFGDVNFTPTTFWWCISIGDALSWEPTYVVQV